MIVTGMEWWNFKSYGNVPTRLEFNKDSGELILLVGKNGAGKTSLVDVMSYVWHNAVYGRNQKRIPLKELPNRMNGNMGAFVEFTNDKVKHGKVERTASPSKVKLYEDGELYPKAGRIQQQLIDHLGQDLDSYRSFVSMSINDFKNFIELSTEDKRVLLDKMFSLEVINQLNKVVKELKKANDRKLDTASAEVNTLNREMGSIRNTMAKMAQRHIVTAENNIQAIRKQIADNKDEYLQLAKDVEEAKGKVSAVADQRHTYETKMQEVRYKKRDIDKQLDLYAEGKCPTCHTELTSEVHFGYVATLKEKREKIEALEAQGARAIEALKDKQQAITEECSKVTEAYQAITWQMRQLKQQLDAEVAKQQQMQEQSEAATASAELEQMLEDMAARQKEAEEATAAAAKQDVIFKKMTQMFSEDGVKQAIISNIVRPINAFIAENMAIVGLPQRVVLDRAFDAKVMHLGHEVNTETLSTGEAKIINICIMLAYIKLIRTKKHINLLFLDEVFASIDMDNIYLILKLLREFARSYNVNVFLVHHSELQDSHFDRIIKIHKNVFSVLEDTRTTKVATT